MKNECCILIKLDLERIRLLKLETNVYTIIDAIIAATKLKIKPGQISAISDKFIKINPSTKTTALHDSLLRLKNDVANVVVKGRLFFSF